MNYKFTFNIQPGAQRTDARSSAAAVGAGENNPAAVTTAENWDRLAAADAMWTVLTDPAKAGGKWAPNEFFATGASVLARIDEIERLGVKLSRNVAVDFGCGIGRVSRWLAKCFSHVVGVDISAKMLELGETHKEPGAGITFVLGNESNIPLASSSADFIHSVIVLQHIPRSLQRLYLKEFTRIVRPGGTLYFQTPSAGVYTNQSSFRTNVQTPGGPAAMELHTFPRSEIESLLSENGCDLIQVRDDDSCGPGIRSFFYVAQRRR